MIREFSFFDEATIVAELNDLPTRDRAKLVAVMEHYEQVGLGDPAPAKIDGYGDGLFRIRHASAAYQGRALFCVALAGPSRQELVVLTVYKKESDAMPKAVLKRALQRKAVHQQK